MQVFGDTTLNIESDSIERLRVFSRLPAHYIPHTLSLVVRDFSAIYLDAVVLKAVTNFRPWENK